MPKQTNSVNALGDALPGLEGLDAYEELGQNLITGLAGSVTDDDTEAPTPPAPGSADDGDAELELSEESIHKLPARERALARRLLSAERQLELMEARLSGGIPQRQATIEEEFEDIEYPEIEGFEAQNGILRDKLNTIFHRVQKLERDNRSLREQTQVDRATDFLNQFKVQTPDWAQYEQSMLEFADSIGAMPHDLAGLQKLYRAVKAERENDRLRKDAEAAKRAGSVPRATPTRTVNRDRMESGNGKRNMTLEESLRQAARTMLRTPNI
jgi:hypothetical protein